MLGLGTMWRYGKIAREALKEEKARGAKKTLSRDEREFQAAAIEILETPPSPTGRLLGFTVIVSVTAALAWSIIGRLDVFAALEGKVVPIGQVKIIQPLITGTVKAAPVRQGQEVAEGELLIELDPTEQTADRARLEQELAASQAAALRLRTATDAVIKGGDVTAARLPPVPGASASVTALEEYVLKQTLLAYDSEQKSFAGDVAQKQKELKRVEATAAERRKLIALMDERLGMIQKLTKSGSASRASYLERAELLFQQRAELARDEGQIPETQAAVEALRRRAEQRKQAFLQGQAKELEDTEKRIAETRQELKKARQKEAYSRLLAPVAGSVQQLTVHTIGQVVTTGQQLMIVAPRGTKLEVEANLLNRDKGFVHEGQEARIKVETFDFTKYGVIDGAVTNVSNDAVSLGQNGGGQPGQGQAAAVAAAGAGALVFPVRIALSRETIRVDGEEVRLTPGMSVVAEVKTGNRRVIEYLLSPLLKLKDEAFRER
jgi:hemolysin D